MIELFAGNNKLSFKHFVFSGGEIQVGIPDHGSVQFYSINAHIESSNDILTIMLVTDAIRRKTPKAAISLMCPYLPYARQDRVMESGEALSIKVMCDLINNQKFDKVTVWDVHSDVSLALLDRVKNFGPETFVQLVPLDKAKTVLVAPDAGSLKKVFKVSKGLGFWNDMVRADKTRSTKDGSITGSVVYSDHIGDNDFLIVDDICDGGKSFTELAKVLKPLTNGNIYLYVTHGIFANGLDIFEDFAQIYCPNPWSTVDRKHPLLTVLPSEL